MTQYWWGVFIGALAMVAAYNTYIVVDELLTGTMEAENELKP